MILTACMPHVNCDDIRRIMLCEKTLSTGVVTFCPVRLTGTESAWQLFLKVCSLSSGSMRQLAGALPAMVWRPY